MTLEEKILNFRKSLKDDKYNTIILSHDGNSFRVTKDGEYIVEVDLGEVFSETKDNTQDVIHAFDRFVEVVLGGQYDDCDIPN